MFLHFLREIPRERMDSEASLHMMSKSDPTSEEQETVRTSNHPSVIMTANFSRLLRHQKQHNMSMTWTDLLMVNSPGTLARNIVRTVTRMNGDQVSHHISSRMGETSRVKKNR